MEANRFTTFFAASPERVRPLFGYLVRQSQRQVVTQLTGRRTPCPSRPVPRALSLAHSAGQQARRRVGFQGFARIRANQTFYQVESRRCCPACCQNDSSATKTARKRPIEVLPFRPTRASARKQVQGCSRSMTTVPPAKPRSVIGTLVAFLQCRLRRQPNWQNRLNIPNVK